MATLHAYSSDPRALLVLADVEVVRERDGSHRGFAFVTFQVGSQEQRLDTGSPLASPQEEIF